LVDGKVGSIDLVRRSRKLVLAFEVFLGAGVQSLTEYNQIARVFGHLQ